MYTEEELVSYGSFENIPNKVLYEYLNQEDTRKKLGGLLVPYRERLKESADAKDKEKKDEFLKLAKAELEQFKSISFVSKVRHRCQTSLPWMACWFTWETNPFSDGQDIAENNITEESHGPLLDIFVKKDPNKKLWDQDKEFKTRMILWPRNGNKSTIDVVDATQWILNFPSIRILYFTGDDDLAVKFVQETKGHFLNKKDQPSLMNLFFPEFCVEPTKRESEFEFNCPLWEERALLRGEPTVQAASVMSGLGGRHYDVVKADDAVYDRNSETVELCQKVSKKIGLTIRHGKMLMRRGYLDIVGTRYNEEDYYGQKIEENSVGDVQIVTDKCWSLIKNKLSETMIFVAKGIVIKPEVLSRLEKEGKAATYKDAGPEGCDLLLPKIMPYDSLLRECADNEETFESQINQNPRSASATTFDRPLLMRNTVRFDELPWHGPVSITWDFAGPFNQKKKGDRDFCTGCAAQWNEKGQCFIVEIVRGRYKPADLAKAVVELALKYHPFVVGIEDATGSRFLEPTIRTEAEKTQNTQIIQVCSNIDWIDVDNRYDAKKLRMAALHPWLTDGRLKFANYLLNGQLEILYNEFEKCLHSPRFDDIPDVISYQPRYAPRIMKAISKANDPLISMSPDKAEWNLLYESNVDQFGRIGFAPPTPVVAPEPEPELTAQNFYPGVSSPLGAGFN